jgi:hypothetical protein
MPAFLTNPVLGGTVSTEFVRKFLVLVLALAAPFSFSQSSARTDWAFAVSGDSRNCGDIVMPAIANSVLHQPNVAFYWHLGDFRLMSDVDEDMRQRYGDKLSVADYWRDAWGDFIANQVVPFGSLPVYLGIGNHELAGNKSPADFLTQFAYWLDTPELRTQRLNEYSQDGTLKPFYHWKHGQVDFIYLDNSGDDGFGAQQMQWFEDVLTRDKSDPEVKALVLGMHRALPNSNACGHSMNGDVNHPSEKGTASGRRAYLDLVKFKHDTNKFVYILASHSHFYMQDIFSTDYWKDSAHGGTVLPGWIVGTAGAQRYPLPEEVPAEVLAQLKAETKVAGYLLGTVRPDGSIDFAFKKVSRNDVLAAVNKLYEDKFIKWCFEENYNDHQHPRPTSCNDK